MFTRDIRLKGKHAYYIKRISERDTIDEDGNEIYRYLPRYIDVYMIGAVLGCLMGRKEKTDNESEFKNETINIFLDTISNEKQNLEFIYRTVLLLDNEFDYSNEKKIDRAFRDHLLEEKRDRHEENKRIFEEYVKGGVSYLYEQIFDNAVSIQDIIRNIKEFVEDFHGEWYLEKYKENLVYEFDHEINF